MAELFTKEWMQGFASHWNAEPELSDALAQIGFSGVIGFGYDGEEKPIGVLTVENGKAVKGETYNGHTLSWDIRSREEQWLKWIAKPPGLMALGMAFTAKKVRFATGDFSLILKDPRVAAPIVKSFAVMSRV